MRIIAGKFKGRNLLPLKGRATRPTSGKVREAIFNICRDAVEGARVLDLFAGTGAFGLEAISRGADHAVFVDSGKAAIELIRKNIAVCRAENHATVISWDILRNLSCLRHTGPFSLVFLDPPYHRDAVLPTLGNLAETGTLSPDATVIIEHGPEEPVFAASGLVVTDRREYGKTLVTFMGLERVHP